MIYKILRDDEYMNFVVDGETTGSPDDLRDGFIHLSSATQISGTLSKHFANDQIVHLLGFEERSFGQSLKWEESRNGQKFPHLYDKLKMVDLVEAWEIDEDRFIPRGLK